MIPGIDVSHWEPKIDWSSVAGGGYKYSFCKATDGASYVDPFFKRHTEGARLAGMLTGGYHYYQNEVAPEAQAIHFVNTLKACPVDLPPVLDFEDPLVQDKAITARNLRVFLQAVQNGMGVRPIIYTNYNSWVYLLGDNRTGPAWSTEYKLWVASYGGSTPLLPKPWTTWLFWQYGETGSVPGVLGNCDVDHFSGTLAELYALAGKPLEPEITHADIMAKLNQIEALILKGL